MQRKTKNIATAFALASAITVTGGCAVMDSQVQSNADFFSGEEEIRSRISQLEVGMDKQEVFETLGVKAENLHSLDRKGIKIALYGSENQKIDGSEEEVRKFLSDMEGYKLDYKSIDRDRSLSFSFRIKTESTGYDMSIYMVFKNGKLFDKPNVKGGLVNENESDPILRLDKAIGSTLGL